MTIMETNQRICLYLAIACCAIASVHSFPRKSTAFDVLVLSQNYPESVCFSFRKSLPAKKCNLGINNAWGIHGLWPTELGTVNPQFCDKTQPFNATAISGLRDELLIKWLNVDGQKSEQKFWKHEWDKHGTCSTQLDELNTQEKYFQVTLDLTQQYSAAKILNQAKIYPGGEYSADDIYEKVSNLVGKRPVISCIKNKSKTKSYLLDMGFCFDKTLEIIDCEGVVGYPSNCSKKLSVTYPINVPDQLD